MKCINATSLRRKSGQWGTQHLLTVRQNYSAGRFSFLIGICSCFFVASRRLPLLWAGVGQIADDLPGSITLALEDVHTRLERTDGGAGAGL
jgi:hypothetical protein